MGRFREFPYRGSLLRKTDGQVQEVFHEPISAKARPEPAPVGLGQPAARARSACRAPCRRPPAPACAPRRWSRQGS